MYCPNCGAQIDEAAAFCPYCGQRFNKPLSPQFNHQSVPNNTYQYPPQFNYMSYQPEEAPASPAHALAVMAKILGMFSVIFWAIVFTVIQMVLLGEL